jgi:site-specific DNA-methyltransferase (adenine-specific)
VRLLPDLHGVNEGLNRVKLDLSVMFSGKRQDWATPVQLFRHLDAEFHFTLDAAADPDTATTAAFFSSSDDSLGHDWHGTVWMNPPYGRKIETWLYHAQVAALHGATVVALVPARTDTGWWHRRCMTASEIRFLRGRLCFDDNPRKRAPFPSAIVIFRPPLA